MIYLAATAVSLAAVIVLAGWLAGRSTPELGGVVIPAGGPANAPTATPAPAPAAPPLPSTDAPEPAGGAAEVSPRPPLGAVHDDDTERDEPDDDLDLGGHGSHDDH